MKEIDFIPEWHKANQNRKKRYHRQYLLLASLLVTMMVWSFVVGQYVKQVRAEVEDIQSVFEKGKLKVNQGMLLESEIASLQHQLQILEATTPRTNISAIIAELSWLIRDNIVLSKLSLKDETIELSEEQDLMPAGIVRIGSSSRGNEASEVSLIPTRTRVILTGIAAKGSDAATLISRLEESEYFEQVSPVYTKAKKVKDYDVTEFEIRMFVADYKIQK
ncbi:MAG: PilN domain-containing protein [Phycisphaerae bacterium]|nr:PilN domain-containing protein [Phycisphaerae bacterium]